jgi:hypothetical protein
MDEATYQFAFIPGKEVLGQRMKKKIETSFNTLDIISASQPFAHAIFDLSEEFSEVLRKGGRIRVIVDNCEDLSRTEQVQAFKKIGAFKLKALNENLDITAGINDKKEVFMSCSSEKKIADCAFLWSNNPNLIEVFQKFFELMWSKSSEDMLMESLSSKQKAST